MELHSRLRPVAVLMATFALLLVPAVAHAYAPNGGGDEDFVNCVVDGDPNVVCVAGEVDENTDCVYETSTGATGDATSNDDGEVIFDFDVPTDQQGAIDVTVECDTQVMGETVENVDAAADVEGETLANAGLDTTTIVGIAGVAIALGAGALVVSRRRTNTRV